MPFSVSPLIVSLLSAPALLNVSSAVSDSSVNISWMSDGEPAEFYVAHKNKRKPLFSVSDCRRAEHSGVEEHLASVALCVVSFLSFLITSCVFSWARTPPLIIHPLCTGEGHWKISEALNTSQTFHIIDGLEPATEYIVRLIPNSWVDHSSIFEDVITTRSTGEEETNGNKVSKSRT